MGTPFCHKGPWLSAVIDNYPWRPLLPVKASATAVRTTLHQSTQDEYQERSWAAADLRELGCYPKRQRKPKGRRELQAEGGEVELKEGVLVIEPSRRSSLWWAESNSPSGLIMQRKPYPFLEKENGFNTLFQDFKGFLQLIIMEMYINW